MKIFSSLLILFIFISCNDSTPPPPKHFDFGKVEGSTYKNVYFGMELSFNSDWYVHDQPQMKKTGDSLQSIDINTATLFTLFKYNIGEQVPFNPSFMIIAENNIHYPHVKTGKDYLMDSKKKLESTTQIKYKFDSNFKTKEIGGKSFDVMEAELNVFDQSITVSQEYYALVVRDFTILCLISYTSAEDKVELMKVLNSLIVKY